MGNTHMRRFQYLKDRMAVTAVAEISPEKRRQAKELLDEKR